MFSTTRMRLGYDVEEVDAFLDHVEWTMDQMAAQVELERARAADAEQNAEVRLNEVRGALENLLFRLGGPGAAGGGARGLGPVATAVPQGAQPGAADPLAAWGSPLPATGAPAAADGPAGGRRSAPGYQPMWGQTPVRPAAVLQVGPPPMGSPVDLPPPSGAGAAVEATKVMPAIGQFPGSADAAAMAPPTPQQPQAGVSPGSVGLEPGAEPDPSSSASSPSSAQQQPAAAGAAAGGPFAPPPSSAQPAGGTPFPPPAR